MTTTTYYPNNIESTSYRKAKNSRSRDSHAVSFDVESILSDLGIRYSIYISKEDFDSTSICNVTDVNRATGEDLSFCSSDDVEKAIVTISKCNAKVIVCHQSLEGLVYPRSGKQQALIFVENPRLAIMKIINEIYYSSSSRDKKKKNRRDKKAMIASRTAIISKSARETIKERP